MGKEGYRLIVKDSGSIPQNAYSLLEELAIHEKVLVVIGLVPNEALKSINTIAAKYHIALVSPSTVSNNLYQQGLYTFSTIPNIGQWGKRMADFAITRLNLTNFAMFYPDTPYGIQLQESFSKRVVELGGNIGKILSYKSASSDLSPQLKDLVELPPQALFLPEDYYGLRLIAPQLAYYLPRQTVLLSCCYKEPPQIRDIKTGGLEGAIFLTEFFAASTDPKIKGFVEDFKRTFGIEPDYWAAQGYDLTNIIFHILQQTKIQGREAVKDRLSGIKEFPGVTGQITLLPNGMVEKIPFMLRIQGGDFVRLN